MTSFSREKEEKIDVKSRIVGTLLGLAAGDRNGGPQRLAYRLLLSIIQHNGFNLDDVTKRYYNWFLGPPVDTSKAFDTGATFYEVFSMHNRLGISVLEASKKYQEQHKNVGVAPAHRNVMLAVCSEIPTSALATCAREETFITHYNLEAAEVAIAVNLICRSLLEGESFHKSLENAKSQVKSSHLVKMALSPSESWSESQLSMDGYAPKVLEAAIYFLVTSSDFSTALARSLSFAGPANYCPVLVGSIGGALWGYGGESGVQETDLDHYWCKKEMKEDHLNAIQVLAEKWDKPKQEGNKN